MPTVGLMQDDGHGIGRCDVWYMFALLPFAVTVAVALASAFAQTAQSVFQFRDRTEIVGRGCVLSHSGSSDLKQRDKSFKRLWQEGRDGGDATCLRDTLLVGGLTAQ